MKSTLTVACSILATGIATMMPGPLSAADAVPVTADNFVRAESDLYFGGVIKDFGFGKLGFRHAIAPIDSQTVIRMNRDTPGGPGAFEIPNWDQTSQKKVRRAPSVGLHAARL
jgi:hypothetical protein